MSQSKKKAESFLNEFYIAITIPKDKFNPHTGEPLHHKAFIKLIDDLDPETTLKEMRLCKVEHQAQLTEAFEERKDLFLFAVMDLMILHMMTKSLSNPLKRKALTGMMNKLQEALEALE